MYVKFQTGQNKTISVRDALRRPNGEENKQPLYHKSQDPEDFRGGGGECDWGRVSMGADPWELGSIQRVDLGGGRPKVNL